MLSYVTLQIFLVFSHVAGPDCAHRFLETTLHGRLRALKLNLPLIANVPSR